MRLNFSASGEDELREGVRRIGGVISEQVALYETLTGEHHAEPVHGEAGPRGEDPEEPAGGDVVPMPRRR
jgi:2-aminoadipate transaminase